MKSRVRLIFITVTCAYAYAYAYAAAPSADSVEAKKADMVIKAIEKPAFKEQAGIALAKLRTAKTDADVKAATIELFEVPASPAKIAAISWYSTSAFDKKPLTQALVLEAQDLPFLIEWMLADGASLEDHLSEWGAIRLRTLDLLAEEANDTLSTSAKVLDARPSKGEEPWKYYTPEMLSQWAQARIRESLANKEWTPADKEVLNGLLSNLEQGKLEKTVGTAPADGVTPDRTAEVEKAATTSTPQQPVAAAETEETARGTAWYWAAGGVVVVMLLLVLMVRARKAGKGP